MSSNLHSGWLQACIVLGKDATFSDTSLIYNTVMFGYGRVRSALAVFCMLVDGVVPDLIGNMMTIYSL